MTPEPKGPRLVTTEPKGDAPDRDRSMRDHYAPSQFRTEAWNMLKQSTRALVRDQERVGEAAVVAEA